VSRIISICGSMQFFDGMQKLATLLRRQSHVIFLPEAEELASAVPKRRYIDAHLEKIRMSDAVLIANFPKRGIDGYVGPNTLMEIAFAYALGKRIYLLHSLGDQGCKEEVSALDAEVLNGDVSELSRAATR